MMDGLHEEIEDRPPSRGTTYARLPRASSTGIPAGKSHSRWFTFANLCFLTGTALYILTRLWRISDFPIFFFCDEAYHQNEIEAIIERGWRGVDGTFLPLFVQKAANRWVPQITLYIYLLPTLLLGKSVLINRGMLALLTVCAPIGCAVAARALGARCWWLAPFVMSAIPTWLLHSRTAFETTLVPSFFACFLGCYLLYLKGRPAALVLAALFGALTVYAHLSGTIIMVCTALVLAVLHIRHHLLHRRHVLVAVLVSGLLLSPLVLFRLKMPAAISTQLGVIESDWGKEGIPLPQKVQAAVTRYVTTVSPWHWFSATEAAQELERHRWGTEPHLLLWTAPLFGLGLLVLLMRFRRSGERAVLAALFLSVTPSLVVSPSIMRVFSHVVPATICIVVGIDSLVTQVARRRSRIVASVASLVAVIFSVQSLSLTRNALVQGPTWFRDYALYGMQYGAQQLFSRLAQELRRDPEIRIFYSVDWANNTDEFARFFLSAGDLPRVQGTSADKLTTSRQEILPTDLFAFSVAEYRAITQSGYFSRVEVREKIPFPDGSPGFFLVNLSYLSDAEALMERKRRELLEPVLSEIVLNGNQVRVRHSQLDMGSVENIFDGKRDSLMRGAASNPFLLEVSYPTPQSTRRVMLDLGELFFEVSMEVVDDRGDSISVSRRFDTRNKANTAVLIDFGVEAVSARTISMKILDIYSGAQSHIHVREFRPMN